MKHISLTRQGLIPYHVITNKCLKFGKQSKLLKPFTTTFMAALFSSPKCHLKLSNSPPYNKSKQIVQAPVQNEIFNLKQHNSQSTAHPSSSLPKTRRIIKQLDTFLLVGYCRSVFLREIAQAYTPRNSNKSKLLQLNFNCFHSG